MTEDVRWRTRPVVEGDHLNDVAGILAPVLGSPEDTVRLFVEPSNFEKAKQTLEEYFRNRDNKS